MERYGRNHIMQGICVIGMALVLVFLALKRFVMDDGSDEHGDARKSGRLD